MRLSSDGRTLNVTTRLTSPGVDCVSIAVLTTPYALVKFAKPSPLVGFWRSEHVDLTENCSQPTTCAAIGGHCLSSPIDPTFAADCAADYGLVASSSGTCAAINETCCVM